MRYKEKSVATFFKVPGGPWLIPVLGILSCVLLLINTTKGTAIRFGIWMAVGHLVYFFFSLRHSKIRREQVNEPDVDMKGQIPMDALATSHTSTANDASTFTIRL